MSNNKSIDRSAILTAIGVLLLFILSIAITVFAPYFIDPSWTQASSSYQYQMYTVADAHTYIGVPKGLQEKLEVVKHIKAGESLLSFKENEFIKIVAPPSLKKYITHYGDKNLKLSSDFLFLREPINTSSFKAKDEAEQLQASLHSKWKKDTTQQSPPPSYTIYELYDPNLLEGFCLNASDELTEDWVDRDFTFIGLKKPSYYNSEGVVYISNPIEYRLTSYEFTGKTYWRYDQNGKSIKSLDELKSVGYLSRKELIHMGEDVYKIEGCWYCHTDQSRTLIQDSVLNGSSKFPAPPSSANEYVFQEVTFPGTRRIGPDLARVGVKRPSRDWHMSHFWHPQTESPGSIMPPFQHFFDEDPRGTAKKSYGLPNQQFEAVYQYLMTKGTRITAPTQAWWLGKDPYDTLNLIKKQQIKEDDKQ